MENENKRFYLTIKGQEVEVSEEIYRAYVRPVRTEQRRKRREWKCQIKGKNGKLVRCTKDCKECPYSLSGRNALGNKLSLDWMKEDGVGIEDRRQDVEQNYMDKEEKEELYAAIAQLTPRQKELVEMIYFEGMSQDKVCEIYGVTKSAISHAMERVYVSLRKFLEKN